MSLRKSFTAIIVAATVGFMPVPAHAGIPVIDVTAIANLIQQILYWQQQITAMSNQLNQLRQTYSAMTGGRGMENLLPMTNAMRNYLPENYADLMAVANGSSTTYSGLASQVQAAVSANAILSSTDLSAMTPAMRQTVEDGRRAAAMLGTLNQAAYKNTSTRFGALQSLITMIGGANDVKAMADLQGRVASEQAMLNNEQTKLQTLQQVMLAEKYAQDQRVREQIVAGHGSFATRFRPIPPP
jgi:type IV secretion system protein VirB5